MHTRFTKALLSLAAVAAVAAPGIAQAHNGSDDPANHIRHEHHVGNDRRDRDNVARHDGRGIDDGVHHDRHGSDDGPNHR
jgi:Ni/Co efflux regulator RcnB